MSGYRWYHKPKQKYINYSLKIGFDVNCDKRVIVGYKERNNQISYHWMATSLVVTDMFIFSY